MKKILLLGSSVLLLAAPTVYADSNKLIEAPESITATTLTLDEILSQTLSSAEIRNEDGVAAIDVRHCEKGRQRAGFSHGFSGNRDKGTWCVSSQGEFRHQSIYNVVGRVSDDFQYGIIRVCTLLARIDGKGIGNRWGGYSLALRWGEQGSYIINPQDTFADQTNMFRCDDVELTEGTLELSFVGGSDSDKIFVFGTWEHIPYR